MYLQQVSVRSLRVLMGVCRCQRLVYTQVASYFYQGKQKRRMEIQLLDCQFSIPVVFFFSLPAAVVQTTRFQSLAIAIFHCWGNKSSIYGIILFCGLIRRKIALQQRWNFSHPARACSGNREMICNSFVTLSAIVHTTECITSLRNGCDFAAFVIAKLGYWWE